MNQPRGTEMTLTALSRRERKKEETRRRIFEAAITLFREKGFEATTVDEITERADVGRGTFFNYFPRKESVLAYLSEERVALAEENAAELLEDETPAREKLLDIFAFAAAAYVADRELSRYVFNEWMQKAFTPAEEAGSRWQRLLVGVIEKGQDAGELRADVSPLLIESLLSSVYISTLYHWLCCPVGGKPAQDFELQAELRTRLELVMDGIATKRGRP